MPDWPLVVAHGRDLTDAHVHAWQQKRIEHINIRRFVLLLANMHEMRALLTPVPDHHESNALLISTPLCAGPLMHVHAVSGMIIHERKRSWWRLGDQARL